MLGGKRENSGRKPISKDLKKKPFTIYLTDKEYQSSYFFFKKMYKINTASFNRRK